MDDHSYAKLLEFLEPYTHHPDYRISAERYDKHAAIIVEKDGHTVSDPIFAESCYGEFWVKHKIDICVKHAAAKAFWAHYEQ